MATVSIQSFLTVSCANLFSSPFYTTQAVSASNIYYMNKTAIVYMFETGTEETRANNPPSTSAGVTIEMGERSVGSVGRASGQIQTPSTTPTREDMYALSGRYPDLVMQL